MWWRAAIVFLFSFSFSEASLRANDGIIDPEQITIIRDQWGVPHIYAPTDA